MEEVEGLLLVDILISNYIYFRIIGDGHFLVIKGKAHSLKYIYTRKSTYNITNRLEEEHQ